MSQGPPKRPSRQPSAEPRVRFNWPPTEDELAQYGAESLRPATGFEEAELDAGGLPPIDASPPTDTIGLFPSERRAARLPGFPPEVPPSPSDPGLALIGGPPSTSGIASPNAFDPPGTGDFADEIAHLQALIEGLTRKIDWRIPNAARR